LKKNVTFSVNGKALDFEVILKEGIRFINFVSRVKGGLMENYWDKNVEKVNQLEIYA
jgi:hypothetical protein